MSDHANTVRRVLLNAHFDTTEARAALDALQAQAEAKEGNWVRKPMWDAMLARAEAAEAERDRLKIDRDNWHASNFAERQARLAAEADRDQLIQQRDESALYWKRVRDERDNVHAAYDYLQAGYQRLQAERDRLRGLLERASTRLMVSEGDARYIHNNVALAKEIDAALAGEDT